VTWHRRPGRQRRTGCGHRLQGRREKHRAWPAAVHQAGQQKRLSLANPTIQTMEKGEIEVGVVWDFNGLSYREQMTQSDYVVLIPSDGSVISGYTTIINKYAKHPNAAKLTREYIFSDAGQINLAAGHARPIRAEHLKLPEDVQAKLLPNEQYRPPSRSRTPMPGKRPPRPCRRSGRSKSSSRWSKG
jgi:ABC-type Fe3+ transport system substrate-binding protein